MYMQSSAAREVSPTTHEMKDDVAIPWPTRGNTEQSTRRPEILCIVRQEILILLYEL